MIFSENNSNIAKAFTQAWGNIETPKHNTSVKVSMRSGGSYSFDYTDLTGIFDAIKEMFKEYGLAIMQNGFTEQYENKTYACVETMILHSTGEWVKSNKLMFPAAGSMQDFGGQITYMKRYSLSALIGLSTDKDDDSTGASGNSYEMNKNEPKQSTYSNSNKPTNASEAAQMVFKFGKHKDKTLKEVFLSDKSYIQWMMGSEKTDPNFLEGINLMTEALANQKANQTQGEA